MKKRQEEKLFDDGKGKMDIWRVENFSLVPQPKEMYGTFFGGDCYIILYTYQVSGRDHHIVYYWLVSGSWKFKGPFTKDVRLKPRSLDPSPLRPDKTIESHSNNN